VQGVDLVLAGGYVVPQDSATTVLPNAAVAVDGDRIVDVGAAADVLARFSARRVIDTTDHVVLPGLVDCHLHTCQTTARGLADDVPVTTWLDRILGFEAKLEAEDVEASVRLTALELIKSGTTGLIEGCAPPAHVDVVGEVLAASGLRTVLTRSTMERADPTWQGPPSFLADVETNMRATRDMLQRWNGAAEGRMTAWPSYRHSQDVSDELIVSLVQLAEEFDVGFHGHQGTRRFGEAERLDNLGVLSERMLFAHAIRYTRREIELLRNAKVNINHNPGASMHGAYGAAVAGQFPEMLQMGIRVCIGCDGAPNNNGLDMFREMYLTATVHKEARMDPTVLPAPTVLRMATYDGARAARWPDVGMLGPQCKADLIVVNLKQPHLMPLNDVISNLVYCANGRDVVTTIVDGRILMDNRQVLGMDEDRILRDAADSAARMRARLGSARS
jgi:5-methylthioadenosine/S-adenosylhomocysteine deaminase